ncbi:AAA family ATPase [Bordetella sp.]|uniref:bifunctional aminoglycoside phosphotransferase/ATP-binding protein n=1 Tax=Bordetella sp. TaxID=28081 RepID=UPI003F7C122E
MAQCDAAPRGVANASPMSEDGADSALEAALRFLAKEQGCAAGEDCAVMETPISKILLAGSHAFKFKRSVQLPYVNYATPQDRLRACEKEIELNRRYAPDLYDCVMRITRKRDGTLQVDGEGALVEPVIKMARFDQRCLLDHMTTAGQVTPALIAALASAIAHSHALAPVSRDVEGARRVRGVLDLNAKSFAISSLSGVHAGIDSRLQDACLAHSQLLDERASRGKVRRCHGDLHLANICVMAGRPVLFDCLEFSDELATTDVLYDLAFPLADFSSRNRAQYANTLMNRYLDLCDEDDGLALMPLFMAMRSCVRALVLLSKKAAPSASLGSESGTSASSYLAFARACLEPGQARLIGIGGLSGSGKSTVAAALAHRLGPAAGARIFNTDRIRKHLFGVQPQERLTDCAYLPPISDEVYALLLKKARSVLKQGGSVVLDGVYESASRRRELQHLAQDVGVPFFGYWLDAPLEVRGPRVAARTGDVSDATVGLLAAQSSRSTAVRDWTTLDATADAQATARRIERDVLGC